ncbi:patatin-like phospholipase family protein [Phytohabitans rumicis]|uniref:Esterase n=1 Tax=Phytohabitans rumicis TaxID=1076125 RepID=A0A6V8LE52_9ACTN|nr:patatin-like phospholipase family protein [Phytohabitans rumicis]GFJ95503.1 esterase [Phytohabitans rumicis]
METTERNADLVLEGGGVKGIGLVGAVSALYEAGYRFGRPGRVAGTSAGSIVGALVAAGMPVSQMVDVMRDLDYRRFQDGPPFGALGRGLSLLTQLGRYRGDHLRGWIAAQLASLGVRTFGDLRLRDPGSDLPPEQQYGLVVIVSDATNGRMVRLPWDYARYGLDPDEQPVADAVRASSSIPFFFRPYRLRLPRGGKTAICTDGGMLSNYPINIFDRAEGTPRWPTFGVKLSARPPDGLWDSTWAPVRGPIGLGKALMATMMNAHDRLYLDDPAVCARTMFVPTDGVRSTDFDLSESIREKLYAQGRAAANDFLTTWDFEGYLRKWRR